MISRWLALHETPNEDFVFVFDCYKCGWRRTGYDIKTVDKFGPVCWECPEFKNPNRKRVDVGITDYDAWPWEPEDLV